MRLSKRVHKRLIVITAAGLAILGLAGLRAVRESLPAPGDDPAARSPGVACTRSGGFRTVAPVRDRGRSRAVRGAGRAGVPGRAVPALGTGAIPRRGERRTVSRSGSTRRPTAEATGPCGGFTFTEISVTAAWRTSRSRRRARRPTSARSSPPAWRGSWDCSLLLPGSRGCASTEPTRVWCAGPKVRSTAMLLGLGYDAGPVFASRDGFGG